MVFSFSSSLSCFAVGAVLPSRRSSISCSGIRGGSGKFRSERFESRDDDGGCMRGGDWDDREESYGRRKGPRRRWSDNSFYDRMEEDFGTENDDVLRSSWMDRIWIFKVLKSYGYLLPAIIASMLLASGPKAFLMAIAVPLGQSALSLAFEELQRRYTTTPAKPRKKPSSTRSSFKFTRRNQKASASNAAGRRNRSYRTWVSEFADDDDAFGGWDELETHERIEKSFNASDTEQNGSVNGSLRSQEGSEERLSREGFSDAPLFLRLLVAVFPFLGSWLRILSIW